MTYSCVLQDSLTSAEDKDNKFSRRGSLLFEVLGVLHNLSKRINNKKHFDNSSAVETLLSFFRTKFPVYRMTALLALAYLVDEKNNHLIMASEGKQSWTSINKEHSLVQVDFLCMATLLLFFNWRKNFSRSLTSHLVSSCSVSVVSKHLVTCYAFPWMISPSIIWKVLVRSLTVIWTDGSEITFIRTNQRHSEAAGQS